MRGLASLTLIGVLADAVFMGLVFTRIQRGQTRATTVVFSDWAVVRRVRGRLRFMFQAGLRHVTAPRRGTPLTACELRFTFHVPRSTFHAPLQRHDTAATRH